MYPQGQSALVWPPRARTPPGGFGAAMCGNQTPLGLSIRTGLGGPDLPFPREGVRCRHVLPQAAKEVAAGPTLPRARDTALRGTPAQLPH
jgi:hypothetical protein